MNKAAVFSEDKLHRYVLHRIWDEKLPRALCIGLNPSTANEEKDDSTIRYLIKTLTCLGYGGLSMCNVYSFITSDPTKLVTSDYRITNDWWVNDTAQDCDVIIFCWGDFDQAYYRAKNVKERFKQRETFCFGRSKKGNPYHPQRLARSGVRPEDVTLKSF